MKVSSMILLAVAIAFAAATQWSILSDDRERISLRTLVYAGLFSGFGALAFLSTL
jgi:hypothetical protein